MTGRRRLPYNPLGAILYRGLPQARQVPRELELGSVGLEEVHRLAVGAHGVLADAPAIREPGDGGREVGGHLFARPRQDLVHARQDLLGRAGEGEVRGRDVVGAQPRRRVSHVVGGGGGGGGGGSRVRDGLAHAHDHQGREHVARAAEVGVEDGELDREEARLAVRGARRAHDRHGGRLGGLRLYGRRWARRGRRLRGAAQGQRDGGYDDVR